MTDAERIKELEARVAELTEEVEDLRATNKALALPEGSVLITSFDWSEVAGAKESDQ